MIDELKQKLQSEVERLNHEINFVLPKEIEKARAHGDLRENSEYKAALERQQSPVQLPAADGTNQVTSGTMAKLAHGTG